MKTNQLFNILFVAFSFIVIALVAANIKMTEATLSKTPTIDRTVEQPLENVVAVSNYSSNAQNQYTI